MEEAVLEKKHELNSKKLNETDMNNRAEYVQLLIKKMNRDIQSESREIIKEQIKSEYHGRILNVILRGYDIPLQGSSTNTCKHMKRVLPEPSFFKKRGYFKSF